MQNKSGFLYSIVRGLGKIILSQGLFVIIIIIITSTICYKVKQQNLSSTVNAKLSDKK